MRAVHAPHMWLSGIVLVALAGVVVDAAQVQRGPTLQAAVRRYLPAPDPHRPIQAAFVLQKQDCSGNLRMLDMLHRKTVRDRLELAVLWYAGPIGDSAAIRAALPIWTSRTPLVPLPQHVLGELQRLGHAATPLLIVLDQYARIRFVSQSPRSSREVAGLARIIDGLTWIEEL